MMFEKHIFGKPKLKPGTKRKSEFGTLKEKFDEARLKKEKGGGEQKTEKKTGKLSETPAEILANELKKGLEKQKKGGTEVKGRSAHGVRSAPKERTSSWKEYNLEHAQKQLEIAQKQKDKPMIEYYGKKIKEMESKKPEKKAGPKFKKRPIRPTELAADIAEGRPYYIPEDAREKGAKIKNIKAKGAKDALLVKKWLEENPEPSEKEGSGEIKTVDLTAEKIKTSPGYEEESGYTDKTKKESRKLTEEEFRILAAYTKEHYEGGGEKPEQKGDAPEAEIEPRQLTNEESGVLANRLLEWENLSDLDEEKKEWLLKALKNDLRLKRYAIEKLDELSEKDMDFLRGTDVKALLDTARHPGFSFKKELPGKEKPAKKETPAEGEEGLTWEEILHKSRTKEMEQSEQAIGKEESTDGITKEKGLNPEEILDEKRSELAREYAQLKEKRLGIFGSERIEDEERARAIASLENDYREALKDYRDDLLDKDPKKYKEIILKTVAEEAEKFYGLKMDFRLEAKKGSKFEKIKKMAGRAVERYRKIPTRYKLLLSAGLFATGVGAGYVGGAAGWALATGVVSGRWFQRIFGGAAAAVGLEAWMKSSQEKGEEKEVLKKFKTELSYLTEQRSAQMDKKLFELEGGKKKKKFRRGALAGTVGVLIMSGMVGKAVKNTFGFIERTTVGEKAGSVFGKIKEWLGFGGHAGAPETPKTTAAPTGKIPSGQGNIHGGGESVVRGTVQISVSPEAASGQIIEIPGTVKVAEGDSLWKISERYLDEKGDLEELNPEQKTYAIDALKDKLAAGIENPDALEAGQEIEFGTKFNPEDIGKFIEDAKGLTPEQIKNISKLGEGGFKTPSKLPQEVVDAWKREGAGLSSPEAVAEITRETITKNLFEDFGVGSKLYDEFAGQNLKGIVDLRPIDLAAGSGGEFWENWSFRDENNFWKVQKAIKEVYNSLPSPEKALADKMSTSGFIKNYWAWFNFTPPGSPE